MIKEQIIRLKETAADTILWRKPETIGTTKITHVLHPSPQHDMVFFTCGNEDITRNEFVFTPGGLFNKGNIAEIIIKKKRKRNAKWHIYPPCRVALRPFNPSSFGIITPEDEVKLAPMLDYYDNEKEPLYSRAFYRKFFEKAKETLTPFPNINY